MAPAGRRLAATSSWKRPRGALAASSPSSGGIITAYVARYAALGEDDARHVLRPGIVRDVDPGPREHELYACHDDRVDPPAVAHDAG